MIAPVHPHTNGFLDLPVINRRRNNDSTWAEQLEAIVDQSKTKTRAAPIFHDNDISECASSSKETWPDHTRDSDARYTIGSDRTDHWELDQNEQKRWTLKCTFFASSPIFYLDDDFQSCTPHSVPQCSLDEVEAEQISFLWLFLPDLLQDHRTVDSDRSSPASTIYLYWIFWGLTHSSSQRLPDFSNQTAHFRYGVWWVDSDERFLGRQLSFE